MKSLNYNDIPPEYVVKSADAQLRNGVIFLWVFGWIDKFIRIKNESKLHEIQLLLAKANYNVIKGN
jgi:hypothetical protein